MKNLCSGTQCGGFQFLLMLDLWGISFHAMVVFGLGKNLLFKSALGHCDHRLLCSCMTYAPHAQWGEGAVLFFKILIRAFTSMKHQRWKTYKIFRENGGIVCIIRVIYLSDTISPHDHMVRYNQATNNLDTCPKQPPPAQPFWWEHRSAKYGKV